MKYFYNAVFVPLSIIIPLVTGILLYRHFARLEKILFCYLFLSGISNALLAFMAYRHMNNLPVFHIYTLLEFGFLVFFLRTLFHDTVISGWLYTIAAVFILFCIINTLFFQDIHTFNSYSRSVEAIIIIGFCLYYFKKQLGMQLNIPRDPGFWFVLGLFIYFSSSLTIFIISNVSLSLNKNFLWIMWTIHASLVLLMYIFITKGFIACKK
ncbi:MAG: hypothetical protein QM737_05895 [Ferruginibacter sp.]